jgi:hypothetical protein
VKCAGRRTCPAAATFGGSAKGRTLPSGDSRSIKARREAPAFNRANSILVRTSKLSLLGESEVDNIRRCRVEADATEWKLNRRS